MLHAVQIDVTQSSDLNRANVRMYVDVHVHSAIMKVAGKRNASTM